MRTKRFFAFLMMCCLAFSLAACGNQTNTGQELDGIFPAIAGEKGTTYQSLFTVILDEQYDGYWREKCASTPTPPLYVGREEPLLPHRGLSR